MKLGKRLAAAAAVWTLAATGWAGSQVSIRLVEASARGAGAPSGLSDVAEAIGANLRFDSYRLLASAVVPLPAARQTRRLGDYEVLCVGPQARLQIEVQRQGQRLLKTTVNLQDGRPFIVNGVRNAAGMDVLVFLAR